MPRGVDLDQRAAAQFTVQVAADLDGCELVTQALHDQRRHRHLGEPAAAVHEERQMTETLRDQPVERVQRLAEGLDVLRVVVPPDGQRCHAARPGIVVGLHQIQHRGHLPAGEAAHVVRRLVDEVRRGVQQHELLEQRGLDDRGQQGDHAAHRVADDGHRAEGEPMQDVEQVQRITVDLVVAVVGVGQPVGATETDMVEQHDAVVLLELAGHRPPRGLVAAEAMREHQCPGRITQNLDVVAQDHIHPRPRCSDRCAASIAAPVTQRR
jgi:hypothetical protein